MAKFLILIMFAFSFLYLIHSPNNFFKIFLLPLSHIRLTSKRHFFFLGLDFILMLRMLVFRIFYPIHAPNDYFSKKFVSCPCLIRLTSKRNFCFLGLYFILKRCEQHLKFRVKCVQFKRQRKNGFLRKSIENRHNCINDGLPSNRLLLTMHNTPRVHFKRLFLSKARLQISIAEIFMKDHACCRRFTERLDCISMESSLRF